MAVPRPVLLLAVVGAALMAATFYAVRGANQASVTNPVHAVPQAPPAPAVKHKAAPAAKHSAATTKHKAAAKHPAKAARKHAHAARPAPVSAGAKVGLPGDVARALAKRHTIVLFFFQRGGADDAATARSVRALGHRRKLSVFTASIRRLSDYRRLISGLDITSAPSTVIVGRNRKARVLEGFVDGRTLAQEVADAAK
jgi:hypothetical protein